MVLVGVGYQSRAARGNARPGESSTLSAEEIRRRAQKAFWEAKWGDPGFEAPWLKRDVSPEIRELVEEGFLVPGDATLDIGCGEGEVVAWLATRGFHSLGVDIADAAMRRARARFGDDPPRLEFLTLDVCRDDLPPRGYRLVVDRGCFHQISPADHPRMVERLMPVLAPDARFMMYLKAFREGATLPEDEEEKHHLDAVHAAFDEHFVVERHARTFMDPYEGKVPEKALRGLVVWMRRRG